MSPDDATEVRLGERLHSAGWRQGAILRSSPFLFAYNDQLSEDKASAELKTRAVRSRECLIIVSQDCDILAESEDHVEALICDRKSVSLCTNILDGNSSRWFLIDAETRLVAQATHKVLIKKELLEECEPEPWPSDEEHRNRFARWLSRRYTRPALPDVFNVAVQKPIGVVLEATPEEEVSVFSAAVREVRTSKRSTEGPPFNVELVLLIVNDDLSDPAADAIESIMRAIQDSLEADERVAEVTFEARTLDEMSLAEYFATHPLYLEYYSFGGEDFIGGAAPLSET